MGQAKNRGTLEERTAAAKLRNEIAERAERERKVLARRKQLEFEASLSPEAQQRLRDKRHQANMAVATLAGLLGGTFGAPSLSQRIGRALPKQARRERA